MRHLCPTRFNLFSFVLIYLSEVCQRRGCMMAFFAWSWLAWEQCGQLIVLVFLPLSRLVPSFQHCCLQCLLHHHCHHWVCDLVILHSGKCRYIVAQILPQRFSRFDFVLILLANELIDIRLIAFPFWIILFRVWEVNNCFISSACLRRGCRCHIGSPSVHSLSRTTPIQS